MFKFLIPLLTFAVSAQGQERPIVRYTAYPIQQFLDGATSPTVASPSTIPNPTTDGPTLFAPSNLNTKVEVDGYIFEVTGWNALAPGETTITSATGQPSFQDTDVLIPATTPEQLKSNLRGCKEETFNSVHLLLNDPTPSRATSLVITFGFGQENPPKKRNVFHLSTKTADTTEPCWGKYAIELLCTRTTDPRIQPLKAGPKQQK